MIASITTQQNCLIHKDNFKVIPNIIPSTYSESPTQRVINWAQTHYRFRTFSASEQIPVRPGLLYFIETGIVRLVSTPNTELLPTTQEKFLLTPSETFLGFVGAEQPFEVMRQLTLSIQAYAHVEKTSVFWMYWHELNNWSDFQQEVMEAFRYQHQRKLLWLNTLSQKQTIDKLIGFLRLLVEEFGVESEAGYYLPFTLTHTQIGNAIGSTRVTVNNLMRQLCQSGLISIKRNNYICLNSFHS
ncbi:MAG TPA: Crp/Fnr family transcriptional regulator [Oculatellaceae cyanobacterium]